MPTVRAATYNIHRGIGIDGRYDPDRIMRVVEALDADIIAFQEVSDRSPLTGVIDLYRRLHGVAGYQVVVGISRVVDGERYGNALLSRFPVVHSATLDITVGDREPRGAIMVELDVGGAPLAVVTAHLGLKRWERRRQFRYLDDLVAAMKAEGTPVIVMGDFNVWPIDIADLRRIGGLIGVRNAPPTFPAPLPVLALDRIWTIPHSILRGVRVASAGQARWASDHRPVVGEVTV